MATASQLLAGILADCTVIRNEIAAIKADAKTNPTEVTNVANAMSTHIVDIVAKATALAAQVPSTPLTITTVGLPKADVNMLYQVQLEAIGGLPPYDYTVS